jgi:RNA polymerase sigma factor (sigma-70 family)
MPRLLGLADLSTETAGERAHLERLCFRLTGDADAAEDLAQETLVEAWRLQHRLHSPDGRRKWLNAIARNMCLRWNSKQYRELQRFSLPNDTIDYPESIGDFPSGEPDVTVELERAELAMLLDRALDLLPRMTRKVLIERYIKDAPQAEIAARLGLTEGAVELRLYRGKLALRKVLATDLYAEASAYRANLAPDMWEESRIWCPNCAGRKLLARFLTDHGTFMLRCPDCNGEPDGVMARWTSDTLFRGIKGHKPALSRLCAVGNEFYRDGLQTRTARCRTCGATADVTVTLPGLDPSLPSRGVSVNCASCGSRAFVSLDGLALCLPVAQRFWREHPRLRTLPEREIEALGQPAIVTTFESVLDASRLAVVSHRDSFAVLEVHDHSGL